MCFIDSKKNHSKRIFMTASHSRTCGNTSWRQTNSSMLSHVRRERFLVITLPAVENKRSGTAEVAGMAGTRPANRPNQGKRCTAPQRHSSREFLSLGKGLPCLDLPVSDLCAWKVERIHRSGGGGHDQEINDIFDWVVDVRWRIWILDLINHGNDHTAQERPALIMLIRRNAVEVWHIARIEKRGGDLFLEKIETLKVNYFTTSLKYTQSKVSNNCTQNKTQATQLGIPARLTAVALTDIGDVSTVAKTLVESSMMSSRILTPRGASIVV